MLLLCKIVHLTLLSTLLYDSFVSDPALRGNKQSNLPIDLQLIVTCVCPQVYYACAVRLVSRVPRPCSFGCFLIACPMFLVHDAIGTTDNTDRNEHRDPEDDDGRWTDVNTIR